MEKLYSILQEIREINEAYGISNDKITELEHEMEDAKVCVPVIGKFSSGKSALINTLLGYTTEVLKEDIEPKTAIPAEVIYADITDILIEYNDGHEEHLTLDEYRKCESDVENVKVERLKIKNDDFLSWIPDVMLVDMPGFESGYEMHSNAIERYLPQGMAYIIAIPADDMSIKASIGKILKELCKYDMPICVAITKCDKCAQEEFEKQFKKMKESLKKYIGDKEIFYCKTSSVEGETDSVENFLKGIQKDSQELMYLKYRGRILAELNSAENYLVKCKNASSLSESELDEEEEKLQHKLETFKSDILQGKGDFQEELEECKSAIKDDVGIALEEEEDDVITMALDGIDVGEMLNDTVKNAVTMSVKKRLVPIVDKYIKKVSKSVEDLDIGDINIVFSYNAAEADKKLGLGTMTALFLLGRAVNPFGGLILSTGAAIANKITSNKRKEDDARKIREDLRNKVYPAALKQVEEGIDQVIKEQIMEINHTVENEIDRQQEILEKAMSDIRNRKQNEQIEKENQEINMNNDLTRLGEIKNEL